ncbi:MAG: molybdopterin cofactor-binding domain-containing protein, partial [Pseudomonadota bacterium]
MSRTTSRRGFLKGTAAASVVLLVGIRSDGVIAAAPGDSALLNPFVKIGADGSVTAIIKHFEKGQGPATGLSTLIAEEIGLRMDQISYEFAPSNPQIYNNLSFGPFQGTGGSTAMSNSFLQYRQAGAAARDMLLAAAAETWNVDMTTLTLENGLISGGGKSAPLGDFVAAASAREAPDAPRLKDPSEFKLIGNPDVRRLDSEIKGNGTALYGMDLHLPNQMIAMIARPDQRGATVQSFDDTASQDVKGYIRAATLPNNAGVVVYAENTWSAMQARDALNVEWDLTAAESRSSDQVKAEIMTALDAAPEYNVSKTDLAATRAAIDGAATVVEKSFYFPLLAHAPMEPMNCTIEATEDGGIRLYDGAQIPTGPHYALMQIFDLPFEKVEIKT